MMIDVYAFDDVVVHILSYLVNFKTFIVTAMVNQERSVNVCCQLFKSNDYSFYILDNKVTVNLYLEVDVSEICKDSWGLSQMACEQTILVIYFERWNL